MKRKKKGRKKENRKQQERERKREETRGNERKRVLLEPFLFKRHVAGARCRK